MAYWINHIPRGKGKDTTVRGYFCDCPEDIDKLPTRLRRGAEQPDNPDPTTSNQTSPGSTATVVSTGDVYMLRHDEDRWQKM